jgi:hypothetical protein
LALEVINLIFERSFDRSLDVQQDRRPCFHECALDVSTVEVIEYWRIKQMLDIPSALIALSWVAHKCRTGDTMYLPFSTLLVKP